MEGHNCCKQAFGSWTWVVINFGLCQPAISLALYRKCLLNGHASAEVIELQPAHSFGRVPGLAHPRGESKAQ